MNYDALLRTIEELKARILILENEIAQLRADNQALRKENQVLREENAELRRRLGLDSTNSSKPPSTDGLKKKRRVSLRVSTGKSSGGQRGHKGHTLKQVSDPHMTKVHAPAVCSGCQQSLEDVAAAKEIKRQVFDIPLPEIQVTEHRCLVKVCPQCQTQTSGTFPPGVHAPVQYGPHLKSMALYLQHQHFIPEDRLQDLLRDCFGVSLATATLTSFTKELANALKGCISSVMATLKGAPVKHLDETGFRVAGQTQWLHVISNDEATVYRVSQKRKDLIDGVTGVIVHDHWKPYFQMEGVSHGLCNAHHLRELKALREIEKEAWATLMEGLLKTANGLVKKGLAPLFRARIKRLYHHILHQGLTYHESLTPFTKAKSKQGYQKRRVGHNLLLRLQDHCDDVLRFLTDPHVPFTNNQAEQDLRMMKVKQKISGGFRTEEGAEAFAIIRSFISTKRKQGFNILESLSQAWP
jgi:transposase